MASPPSSPRRALAFLVASAALLAHSDLARAVDGVVEINDARAMVGGITPGDAPGYPVTLSVRGSYKLTSNLFVTATNIDVVNITADGVSLDLNGFAIRCLFVITPCAGNGSGNGIIAFPSNVTVRNGTVRDMAANGVVVGTDARVEDLTIIGNGKDGLSISNRSLARNLVVSGNATVGIDASEACQIEGSTISNNHFGILAGGGALVRGNVIRGNEGVALGASSAPTPTGYQGNVISRNNGTTDLADGNQGITGINLGGNVCGTNTTCP
jgi:hypothetical protein